MDFDAFIELVKEQQGIDLSGVLTTADKIDRPERALERQAIIDFENRNPMAGGGMLVQPSADGSRPGYAKDKRQYISAEEKYTGSAKPPKKKKWQGVFGKEKADEIYNDYVKFYTDAGIKCKHYLKFTNLQLIYGCKNGLEERPIYNLNLRMEINPSIPYLYYIYY